MTPEGRILTITPSEVIRIILVSRSGPDPFFSREGQRQHRRVIRDLKSQPGKVFQGFESSGPFDARNQEIQAEKTSQIPLGRSILLRARNDALIGENTCLEIKPGPIKGRYLLQSALGCMAHSGSNGEKPTEGLIHLYRGGATFHLDKGARPLWPRLRTLSRQAAVISDIQNRLDKDLIHKKRRQLCLFETRLTLEEIKDLSNRSIRIRRGFDRVLKNVLTELPHYVHRLS